MAATTLADGIRFNATSTGTGDFVDASAVTGYRRGGGNLVDGKTYRYRAENASLSEYERGSGVWNNSTGTLARTAIDYSSTGSKVSFSSVPQVGITPGPDDLLSLGDALSLTSALINGKITESRSGNAVTFAVKTIAGADASAADPVTVIFGDGAQRTLTAALSVTLSSGSTAGFVNSVAGRLWHVIIDDGGTLRLGVRNCSDANGFYGFPGNGILSSTAEGGAGAADSAGVTYTGTAVTAKPFVIVAFAEYDSGLATAGTWNVAPSRIMKFIAGMAKPGDRIQLVSGSTASQTGTTSTSYVDSALTVSITPTNAANLVRSEFSAGCVISNAGETITATMAQDGTAIGSAPAFLANVAGFTSPVMHSLAFNKPNKTTVAVYRARFKSTGGNTVYFSGNSNMVIEAEEIMG